MAGWLGRRVRARARSLVLNTLQRAFDTDEGREIAFGALNGLLRWRPRLPVVALDRPYDDLGDTTRRESVRVMLKERGEPDRVVLREKVEP